MLRAAGRTDITATAITHLTAKWPWLAERAGTGRHLLRLSYRGADDVPDDVVAADAAALLGLDGAPRHRHGPTRSGRTPRPPLAPETIAIRARARLGPLCRPGSSVIGSWVAGTGLASVVARAGAGGDDHEPPDHPSKRS